MATAAASGKGTGQKQQQQDGGGEKEEPSGASAEEIRQKGTRIKMLETQMVENARGFAKELSVLKMKVMELDLMSEM